MRSNLSLEEAMEMFPEVREELPLILNEMKKEVRERAVQLNNLKKMCLDLANKYWDEQKYQDSIRVEGYYYSSPAHDRFKQLTFHVKHIEALLTGNKDFLSQNEIDRANTVPMSVIMGKDRSFYRCPFHDERTASFHVTKNKWYCHGCQQGGTTIGFVMKRYNLPFREAVRAINSYKI